MHFQLLSSVILLGALSTASAESKFNPLEHLTGIAPYYFPKHPALDGAPPQGCNVTRAAYLVRHAAIYANDFDYESYLEPFINKLRNTTQDWSSVRGLQFLSNWSAPVDEEHLEKITRVGYQEASSLGSTLRKRYSGLKAPEKVWSSSADRTVRTADGFIAGFTNQKNSSVHLQQVEEGKDSGADSLTPHKSCPAYSGSYGSDQSQEWVDRYTKPIIERLNSQASTFNFTVSDVVAMFELCGYETVIRGSSGFCSQKLFSQDDWLAFEYGEDVRYFHNAGYGRDFTPRVGYPWVKASTDLLDDSASEQDLYVSFTHRELPPMVITALGLYNNTAFSGANNINGTMPTDRINYNRAWVSSRILSFLTNIAIERMECDSFGYDEGDYYRVLVNAGPQPLAECRDGPGDSCSDGKFKDFVNELDSSYGGDFDTFCGTSSNISQSLSIYE
ncbi:putative histidine acid phosphatase [Aspergillus affinis]|uniref:putative histidine acid phosphatase n=1 Tax=Aspergillus affinis TaxID=1070780 RepID=UPI0022FEF30B|nr:multiple inositol polyphosphate phosphatase [Aspergillus affinis]KAI9041866.1 multiple inositol polyphosphate phosphatase [Aspergillus affinis]